MSERPTIPWVEIDDEGLATVVDQVIEERMDPETALRNELEGYLEQDEWLNEGEEPQPWTGVLDVIHAQAVEVRNRLNGLIGFLDDLEDNHPDLARGELP